MSHIWKREDQAGYSGSLSFLCTQSAMKKVLLKFVLRPVLGVCTSTSKMLCSCVDLSMPSFFVLFNVLQLCFDLIVVLASEIKPANLPVQQIVQSSASAVLFYGPSMSAAFITWIYFCCAVAKHFSRKC